MKNAMLSPPNPRAPAEVNSACARLQETGAATA